MLLNQGSCAVRIEHNRPYIRATGLAVLVSPIQIVREKPDAVYNWQHTRRITQKRDYVAFSI